jgi:hypothetical protein
MGFSQFRDLLDLALAEQGRRTNRTHAKRPCRDHVDANRFGEALRFLDARFGGAPRTLARQLRNRDDRTLAASDIQRSVSVEPIQDPASPVSSPPCSPFRLSGCAG